VRKIASRVLSVLGVAWIAVGAIFILLGSASVWIQDGFLELVWLFSPFSTWNFLLMIAVLAPGFFFLWMAAILLPEDYHVILQSDAGSGPENGEASISGLAAQEALPGSGWSAGDRRPGRDAIRRARPIRESQTMPGNASRRTGIGDR
jgi:hypothetical protein